MRRSGWISQSGAGRLQFVRRRGEAAICDAGDGKWVPLTVIHRGQLGAKVPAVTHPRAVPVPAQYLSALTSGDIPDWQLTPLLILLISFTHDVGSQLVVRFERAVC